MSTPKRINVVFIYTVDMERARRFYEEVVGFGKPILESPEWVEYSLEEGGANFALHKTGSDFVRGIDRARNTVKCSIVIDDLEESYKRMSAQEVVFTRAPEDGPGFKIAEFEDPEGNPIRLIQFT